MKKKLPSLAVVIPCYNEEATIRQCLGAVLEQSYAPAEIIVVDNNSTDDTVAIVKRLQQTHPVIRLLHEPRQGVQFARNTGLDATDAEIIARIDADSRPQPGWAQAVAEYYRDDEHAQIGSASGTTRYYDLPFQKITGFFTDLFTHRANQRFADEHAVHGANMTLRRSAWRKVRGEVCMRHGIMEDQDLGYHFKQNAIGMGYIEDALLLASGRRLRMSPLRFWRYNQQWWMTYENHGLRADAWRIRVTVWAANAGQAIVWFGLLFHDPVANKFRLLQPFKKRDERVIP